MKIAGIIGGIGPESTIEYYRQILAAFRERKPDAGAPQIVVNSVDMKQMLTLIAAHDLARLTEFLTAEVQRLARAGAQVGLISAVTPHLVFDEIQSPIPLISIVQATSDAAKALGLMKLGLFGTRFTMQARFFPDVLAKNGIALAVPAPEQQDYIHQVYFGELVQGTIRPETRERLLAIVDQMRRNEGIEGLIIGGTDLSVILADVPDQGIPFLDATRIHVQALVSEMLS
jgi:aspartate racemase